MERTQVAIVGAGPAGLLLAHLLGGRGIESVVLESRSRAYVEARVRAGVLEAGAARLLRDSGVGARLDREGLAHGGSMSALSWAPPPLRQARRHLPQQPARPQELSRQHRQPQADHHQAGARQHQQRGAAGQQQAADHGHAAAADHRGDAAPRLQYATHGNDLRNQPSGVEVLPRTASAAVPGGAATVLTGST
jgi:hypothetical protein